MGLHYWLTFHCFHEALIPQHEHQTGSNLLLTFLALAAGHWPKTEDQQKAPGRGSSETLKP